MDRGRIAGSDVADQRWMCWWGRESQTWSMLLQPIAPALVTLGILLVLAMAIVPIWWDLTDS